MPLEARFADPPPPIELIVAPDYLPSNFGACSKLYKTQYATTVRGGSYNDGIFSTDADPAHLRVALTVRALNTHSSINHRYWFGIRQWGGPSTIWDEGYLYIPGGGAGELTLELPDYPALQALADCVFEAGNRNYVSFTSFSFTAQGAPG